MARPGTLGKRPPPPWGHPSFETDVSEARFSGRSTWTPTSWAVCPVTPWGFPFLMLPLGPPDDSPQACSVTHTVSSPHSAPTGRQQRLHRPGAGEAAGVPALCHPGRQAPPGEALAQGRAASECRAPACVAGSGAQGRGAGGRGGRPGPALASTLLIPCFGMSSSFLSLSLSFLPLSRTFSDNVLIASSPSNVLPGLRVAACPLGAWQECLATLSAEGREQEFGGAQTHVLVGRPRSERARAEMWPVRFGVSPPDFLARAEHTVAALSICMDLVFSVFFCSRLLFAPLPPPFPSVLLPGPQT